MKTRQTAPEPLPAFSLFSDDLPQTTMTESQIRTTAKYQPEIWRVEKDTIYAAIPAVESGLEYARECLAQHETALGRTTLKNKTWAETMEKDIRHMERTLEMLRACGPNTESCHLPPAREGN
jgi:hypothetical protein